MRAIVVCEGDELHLPEELRSREFHSRLRALSDSSTIPMFQFLRNTVRAAAVVGTVTCGKVRIEIRPKARSGDDANARRFLLGLLRFAGYLKHYHVASGRVPGAAGDPLDVLIAEVAEDMIDGLREGVPRRYALGNYEAATVRGRIDFTRLSTRLPGQTFLPLRYAPLTPDNSMSGLIKWTARLLLDMTHSAANRERLSRVVEMLSDVDGRSFAAAELGRFSLSRFEARWEGVLTLAQQLSRRRSLDPATSGSERGITLVFQLDRLFERCLRRLLAEALPKGDITVSHHTDELYMLESDDGERSAVRLRPDFVYRRGERAIALGDAKWKALVQGKAAYGVDPGDLYQLNSYITRYGVNDALLFYPRTEWMAEGWSDTYRFPGSERRLHFIGVDIEALVSADSAHRLRARESLEQVVSAHLPRVEPITIS